MTQRTRFTCAPASFSPQTFSALHYISGASFFYEHPPDHFRASYRPVFFSASRFSFHRFSFTVFVASTDFRAVASMKVIQMVCEVNGKKSGDSTSFSFSEIFKRHQNDLKVVRKPFSLVADTMTRSKGSRPTLSMFNKIRQVP